MGLLELVCLLVYSFDAMTSHLCLQGCLFVYKVFRHPPLNGHSHQQSEIRGSRCLDSGTNGCKSACFYREYLITSRAIVSTKVGKPESKPILGGALETRTHPTRSVRCLRPPDHTFVPYTTLHLRFCSKMESYIRSKYESKRWAREGPPPQDPAVLDGEAPAPAPAPAQTTPAGAQVATPTHASRASVSSLNATRSQQPHQLLSTAVAASRQAAAPTLAAPQQQQPQAAPQAQVHQQQPQAAAVDLFSLDFHAPSPAQPAPQEQQPKKDVKAEIMSLFSTAAPAQPNPMAYAQQQQQAAAFGGAGAGFFGGVQPQMQAQGQFGGMGGLGAQQNVWGASPPVQQQQPQQQTSMMGNAGVGMWGASSGWNAAPAAPAQPDIWGTPSMGVGAGAGAGAQQSLFSTSDVWSTPATTATTASAFGGAPAQKKDDAFGDLWGGFK